jgi:small GTP-binding protein
MAEPHVKRHRVVLIGNAGVGKTSLVMKLQLPDSPLPRESTLSPKDHPQEFTTSLHQRVILDIWDTAGQEKYRAISSLYFRRAQVAIVCFDPLAHPQGSNSAKDTSVREWVDQVHSHEPDCKIVLVGTKSDLMSEAQRRAASDVDESILPHTDYETYFLTSALTGEGVHELFALVADVCGDLREYSQSTVTVKNEPPRNGCCE